jgi:arylsulfatase A-like enzyme
MFHRFLGFLLAASVVHGGSLAIAQETRPPNIVFILADDLGWTDLGCQGSKYYETPHIDRLAREGRRFTDAYTAGPNCQPTRAALMSGQYGPRTGVYTVGAAARFDTSKQPLVPVPNVVTLPLNRVTVGAAMKQAGYATALLGKWHLGEGPAHHPGQRGFDTAIVSMGKHFDFATNPKTAVPKGAYLADWLTDRAEDFIRKNKERPFFLCLTHFGVHSPFEAKKGLIDHFRDKPGNDGHRDPTYAAMIASVDESVGRVMKLIDDLNLGENTVIIFTSDNGGVGGYEAIAKNSGITSNRPLRGGKGMLYDGGVRVPWIVRWKGTTSPGSTCSEPIISVDLFPTCLSLAKFPSSKAVPKSQPLDGADLTPLFRGDGSAKLDRKAIYWHFPGYLGQGQNAWRTKPAGAIRAGDWKLHEFFIDGKLELYNLRDDLGESKNLADAQPERRDELARMLRTWRTEVNAPMPAKR